MKFLFPKFAKETARDLIALGSPLFFIIVLARVALLSNYAYLSQFIIAGTLFYIAALIIKADFRAGLGVILLVFLTNYYGNEQFSWFARILFITFIGAIYYLNQNKKLEIVKSIIIGILATTISWYAVSLIF